MHTKRPLVPGFLNKLDAYLLLNKPAIWSARAHLVIYYGLLFIVALAVLCYIIPDDPRTRTTVPEWIGFVSIISVIGLIVWLRYLLRFNVFKRYGIIKPLHSLIMFFLYFISVGMFVLFSFVKPYVETYRANKAYTSKELVDDINAINIKISQLEYDSMVHEWKIDTVVVRDEYINDYSYYYDKIEATEVENQPTIVDTVVLTGKTPYKIIDTASLARIQQQKDSLVQINDSMYAQFECPQYAFATPYNANDLTIGNVLNDKGIFDTAIKNYKAPNRAQVRQELAALLKKYAIDSIKTIFYGHGYYEEGESSFAYIDRINSKYNTSNIKSNMGNIIGRKYNWTTASSLQSIIRIFYYITLFLALLVFIFRHSTKRTFFLSLLTAFILTALTSLWISLTSHDESLFYKSLLFYFVLFLALASLVWRKKKRSVVTGVSINLLVLLTPVLPLIIISWYIHERTKNIPYYIKQSANYDDLSRYFLYSELAGMFLLLVLIATYYHGLYRKWYALPEQ